MSYFHDFPHIPGVAQFEKTCFMDFGCFRLIAVSTVATLTLKLLGSVFGACLEKMSVEQPKMT